MSREYLARFQNVHDAPAGPKRNAAVEIHQAAVESVERNGIQLTLDALLGAWMSLAIHVPDKGLLLRQLASCTAGIADADALKAVTKQPAGRA